MIGRLQAPQPTPKGGHDGRPPHLVQPDALAGSAGQLPRGLPLGVGRHPQQALRPQARPPPLPPVHGPARVRRVARLRRHRRQRAPSERLRADAVAEHHRRRPRAPHFEGCDLRDRQLDRALQPADPRRRRVRDARRHLGRAPGRRLPGRHADGHQLLLRPDPGAHPRQVLRGARADHEGVGLGRRVRVRRQVQPAPPRQPVAQADPEAAPADLHPGRRLGRDLRLLRRQRLQLLVPLVHRLQGRARR